MHILLGVAHTGTVAWNSGRAAWKASANHTIEVADLPSSLPALGFNTLYCEALNRQEAGEGVTHFAMLHGDLAAEDFWLDRMLVIMEERGADLVSAINAIKDDRGLTSSGIALPGHSWRALKRFTFRELAKFPATFDLETIGVKDCILLHNTGCWVADLRKPLFHEADADGQLRAFFTIRDRVVRRAGKWRPEVEPEDWFFSRRLHDLGAKTFVTREVVTRHYGTCECDNQLERGSLEVDTDLGREWQEVLTAQLVAQGGQDDVRA